MPPEYALQVAFANFMTGNVFSHKIISCSLTGGGEMTPFLIKWGCKLPSSIISQHNFLESSLFSLKTILSWLQREVRASESYLSRWFLTKLQPHFNITGIDWGLSSIGMMPPTHSCVVRRITMEAPFWALERASHSPSHPGGQCQSPDCDLGLPGLTPMVDYPFWMTELIHLLQATPFLGSGRQIQWFQIETVLTQCQQGWFLTTSPRRC